MNREWFTVELPNGTKLAKDGNTPFELPNGEAAVALARELAPSQKQPLTVVKHIRREVRTFTKRVLIDEADVATPPA